RGDLVEYFYDSLQGLEPDLREKQHILELTKGIGELREMLDLPPDTKIDEERTEELLAKAQQLIRLVNKEEKR
ncbi:MAG: hypothetical protein ACR2RV_05275, partial [Verrucomicrobiales bacterium]